MRGSPNQVSPNPAFDFQELSIIRVHAGGKKGATGNILVTERVDGGVEAGSTVSLTRSIRRSDND